MSQPLQPSDGQASPAACRILNWIADLQAAGRTIAGQYLFAASDEDHLDAPHKEPAHIQSVTGRRPALLEQCFTYSPRHFRDMHAIRQFRVDQAIEHWRRGGLVSFCWHQVTPRDTAPDPVDEGGWDLVASREVYRGGRYEEVLTPGSVLHGNWLAIVDRVAGHLRRLQDAGVVAFFRPYHEMNGNWFWWCNPTEQFHRLWRMLHRRLTVDYGLHNLLWVWAPSGMDKHYDAIGNYYPGREYVDVVGCDCYAATRDDPRFAEFAWRLHERFRPHPVALTETGLLPKADVLTGPGGYAWFEPWSGGFCDSGHFEPRDKGGNAEVLREVYNHPAVLTLENLDRPV